MRDGVRFVQINLHHCFDANDALIRYSNDNNIHFFMCQDPYTIDGRVVGVSPDWLIFSSLNNTAAVICTNKTMNCVVSLRTNNSVFITVVFEQITIVMGSVYSAPSSDIDLDMSSWLNYYMNCDKMLIGGDFNVPLISYGYTGENERSEIFQEHIMTSNLKILNDPGAPHSFVQGERKGRPDLTLAGVDVIEFLDSWSVDDKTFSFSDHRYLVFDLKLNVVLNTVQRYKTKHKSMAKFNKLFARRNDVMHEKLERVRNTAGLETWMTDFNDYIQHVMGKCFSRGSITHRPTTTWYTNALKTERNRVNALYKRHRKNLDNMQYRDNYLIGRRLYKQHLRSAKRSGWLGFCRRTDNAYGNLYKYISGKKINHSDMAFSTLENSSVFASYDDVATTLMKDHFNVDLEPDTVHDFESDRDFGDHPDFYLFTRRELQFALHCQNNNKAPGADEIDAIIVKNMCTRFRPLLLTVFNTCLRLGHFPTCWKRGIIIFFKKKNRSAAVSNSYRPITLLPILGKIYERMLKVRILTMIEASNFLSNSQHGFRESRSTITALSTLKNLVKNKLTAFVYCSAISFDISGAFDVLDWSVASSVIDALPIHNYLKFTFKNYISSRLIGFRFLGGIRWFRIFRGCPQGSCLGPLIWTIVADLILKNGSRLGLDLISYADDTIMIDGANTRHALETKMNVKIDSFATVCQDLNLSINPGKTEAMMFGTKTCKKRRPIFKLNQKSIPVKDTLLYLGFMLDNNFTWLPHLEMIRSKLLDFTCNMKRTRIRDQGVSLYYLKLWYQTVLLKQISYGHEIWFSDLKYNGLNRLSSCQRVCLLSFVRAYRSTSTDALCVLAGVPPIHLQLEQSSLKYAVLHDGVAIDVEGVHVSSNVLSIKIPSFEYPYYYAGHNVNFIKPIKRQSLFSNHPVIFTDGSKMDQGVSAAYSVFRGKDIIFERSIKLNHFNSVYQAELVAISDALDWCHSSDYSVFFLFTDSLSSYASLQRVFPTDALLFKIYTNLRLLINKVINIGWVKAHVGIVGNERADFLAKSVILNDDYDLEENIPIPLSFLNRGLKNKLYRDWQNYWDNSTKGRDTYDLIQKVNPDYICYSQICIYFYTGHGAFPTYLKKIGKSNTDLCTCGKRGNVFHFLFETCRVSQHSFDYIRNRPPNWNISRTLGCRGNYDKLKKIYNSLNKEFSFIRYVF